MLPVVAANRRPNRGFNQRVYRCRKWIDNGARTNVVAIREDINYLYEESTALKEEGRLEEAEENLAELEEISTSLSACAEYATYQAVDLCKDAAGIPDISLITRNKLEKVEFYSAVYKVIADAWAGCISWLTAEIRRARR